MVRNWAQIMLFLCFCSLTKLEGTPLVEASIAMDSQAHFPLQGTITITHNKQEKIDSESFALEGKPLDVSFVKDVKMSASSDTLLSIYSFQLPSQEVGLYVLPAISVEIGGHIYHSSPTSYDVDAEGSFPQSTHVTTATAINPSNPIIFRLEAMIDGPNTLYPGERTKLIYRISYNRSIDLNRSDFPMIHPDHFRKVGDVQIKDYQTKEATVQDLIQEVEASELGTFSYGPSSIEGYAYQMKAGQKVYDSTPLKAEAPVVTLFVKPFPSSLEPASFTNALGEIEIKSQLHSKGLLQVDENLQLLVEIKGIANLSEFHLPSLQCQPGFSGFFQTSDIPPLSEVKDQSKLFYVDLRPLTSLITQIPPIEVSSFDSDSGQYVVKKSTPIPVTITPQILASLPEENSPTLFTQLASIENWPIPILPPLELEGPPPVFSSLSNHASQGKWVTVTLILATVLLLLQKYWKKKRDERRQPQAPQSEKLFKQALKNKDIHLLEIAFWQRLWEKGIVPLQAFQLSHLREINHFNSIYSFIYQLQALQYSSDKTVDFKQLQKEAKKYFETIEKDDLN